MKQIEQQNKRVSPSPQKGAITERGLFRLMLPSLLGILLCSTCLAGLTWACFSDSVTSSANTITAATFTVEVTITEITENAEGNTLMVNEPSVETKAPSTEIPTNEEGGTDTGTGTQPGVTTTGDGSYSLEAGMKYTVTLTARGTATGYCNISFGDKEYHTVALGPNEKTISFTVCASEAYTSLTIAPQWGTYHAPVGGTDTAQIDNKGSIGTPTTDDNTPKQILKKETVQLKKPTPVEPTPVEPTPVEPTPVEPTPVEPTPVEPTPVEPTPVEPTPVEPTPVEPTPVEPTPVEPTPVEPTPVEPTPAE